MAELDPDLVAELVRELDAEVCNGGFNQYFFGAAGDRAGLALQALTAIGALDSLAIMVGVCAMFPDFPPEDRVERRKLLETVDPDSERFAEADALFQDNGDDLAALAKAYRRR